MDMTTCYCCGAGCYQGGGTSCCQPCSCEVHVAVGGGPPAGLANRTDPKIGDSFPTPSTYWQQGLDTVKARKSGVKTIKWLYDVDGNKVPAISDEPKKKSYGDQCPCGIHPQACPYHCD